MKLFNKKAYRPSSISRFIACNLHAILPEQKRSDKDVEYLSERTSDHSRLEREEFLQEEKKCKEYFKEKKKKCIESLHFDPSGKSFFFKENKLRAKIDWSEINLQNPPRGELLEGTPDVYGLDAKNRKLYILDYKTGHKNVSAKWNMQLMIYAILVKKVHIEWNIGSIVLAILNTKSDTVSEWEYSDLEEEHLFVKLLEAFESIEREEVIAVEGEHCRYCPSARYCPLKGENHLENISNKSLDLLMLEAKKRAKDIALREEELKSGAESDVFFPITDFFHETKVRKVDTSKDVPENFFKEKRVLKSLADLEKEFGKDFLEDHIKSEIRMTFRLPKE